MVTRRHSKMAVSRHLGFYGAANIAIWSANPENLNLEPNMEWIGCTVCEIFAFKLHYDLETGVRGHSRSSKVALFDRAHTTLYSSSIVTFLYLLPFPGYSRIMVENCYPPCIWRPIGGEAVRFTQRPWVTFEKLEWWAYQIVKEFWWCVQRFWHNTRVWQSDGRTELAWHIRTIVYMLSRVMKIFIYQEW